MVPIDHLCCKNGLIYLNTTSKFAEFVSSVIILNLNVQLIANDFINSRNIFVIYSMNISFKTNIISAASIFILISGKWIRYFSHINVTLRSVYSFHKKVKDNSNHFHESQWWKLKNSTLLNACTFLTFIVLAKIWMALMIWSRNFINS